jgi:hypothetical protein
MQKEKDKLFFSVVRHTKGGTTCIQAIMLLTLDNTFICEEFPYCKQALQPTNVNWPAST